MSIHLNILKYFKGKSVRHTYWENPVMIAGHRFYAPKNMAAVYVRRAQRFQMALRETEIGITIDESKKVAKMMKKAFNEKDDARLGFYIEALNAHAALSCFNKNVFDVASAVTLIDDENPEKSYSPEHQEKKHKLYYASEDVRAFFFSTYNDARKNSGLSMLNLSGVDYLRSQQVQRAEKILRMITSSAEDGENTSQDGDSDTKTIST